MTNSFQFKSNIIITKVSGTLEILANQVLEIVNNMPQKCKPTMLNNQSFGCISTPLFFNTKWRFDFCYLQD
jgi:hypothetical protein